MPSSQPDNSIKFDPQSYLLSYFFDDETPYYTSISSVLSDQKYNYVISANAKKSVPTLIGRATSKKDFNLYNKIAKEEFSMLNPIVELYRVDYDEQKKVKKESLFAFGSEYNSFLTNMSWKIAGSNPVTAEKQVEVTMKFEFYGLDAFSGGDFDALYSAWGYGGDFDSSNFVSTNTDFVDEEGKQRTKNYWSLIFHPKLNDDYNGGDRKNGSYDTYKFRIKAVIKRDTKTARNSFIEGCSSGREVANDLLDDLEKSSTSFFLNLVKHEFETSPVFGGKTILKGNTEPSSTNVKITLTTTYIASFESATQNYSFNILGNLSERLDDIKNKTLKTLGVGGGEQEKNFRMLSEEQIKDISNSTGASEEEIENSLSALENFTYDEFTEFNKLTNAILSQDDPASLSKCGQLIGQTNLDKIKSQERSKNVLSQVFSKVQESATKAKQNYTLRIKNIFYSNFLTTLFNNSNPIRYNTVLVSADVRNDWERWATNNGAEKPQWQGIIPYGGGAGDNGGQKFIDDVNDAFKKVLDENDASGFNDELDSLKEEYKKNSLLPETDTSVLFITFTSFGHIIDSAYNSIINIYSQYYAPDEIDALEYELARHKTILTSTCNKIYEVFSINNPNPPEKYKNISSIPIDINLLKIFLIDNIIRPQRTIYSLFSFLQDAISVLLINALNMRTVYNNNVNEGANISVATTTFSLGTKQSTDPFIDALKNSLNFDSYYINSINNHNDYYHYYLVYDKSITSFDTVGNQIEDQKNNIAHLYQANSFGLTRQTTFNRIDQPYLKEAKSVGQKTLYLGQFRDFYNCNIDLVGNNFFYPGMLVYTQPFSEAPKQFSWITGIGGYYMVIQVESTIDFPSSWTTKLTCVWNSDGRLSEKPNATTKENGDSNCETIAKELTDRLSGVGTARIVTVLDGLTQGILTRGDVETADEQAEREFELSTAPVGGI